MKSYRTLVAWQLASVLCINALKAIDRGWSPRGRVVFDQLQRAVVSADVNIVEGYALDTPAQFRRHLRISLASAAEAERLIEISGEMSYLPPEVAEPLIIQADRVQKVVVGLIRSPHLRSRPQ